MIVVTICGNNKMNNCEMCFQIMSRKLVCLETKMLVKNIPIIDFLFVNIGISKGKHVKFFSFTIDDVGMWYVCRAVAPVQLMTELGLHKNLTLMFLA